MIEREWSINLSEKSFAMNFEIQGIGLYASNTWFSLAKTIISIVLSILVWWDHELNKRCLCLRHKIKVQRSYISRPCFVVIIWSTILPPTNVMLVAPRSALIDIFDRIKIIDNFFHTWCHSRLKKFNDVDDNRECHFKNKMIWLLRHSS